LSVPKKRIRVMRLIARMNVGGPAIQITGLMSNLDSEDFEQKLITGFCDTSEVDYLEVSNKSLPRVKIEGFGRSVNLFSDLRALLAIRREIKNFDPDIIHTHTAKAGFLGRIASLTTPKRHIRIHTFHGHLLQGYFGKFRTRLVILAERVLAEFTDKLVAVGDQVRGELLAVKIGSLEKFTVIGPGLEIRAIPERVSSLRSFSLPEDRFIVTWIGRAVPVKAPHRIIEIAAECEQRRLKVQFVLVGEGPLLSDLKDVVRQRKLAITFLGWQSDIEKVLSFSDLVLLTSENEGTPVALIQAQMAGIPVLTTNVGSAPEVMINEQSGFCLKYSAKDFADKVELLAKNDCMRLSFGAAGKSNSRNNFSLSRLVSDHTELYRDLISQLNSYPKLQPKHMPDSRTQP
jgi:glycosyltransferase involved in cell wall biosynthesis